MLTVAIVGSRSLRGDPHVLGILRLIGHPQEDMQIITGDCPTGIDAAVRSLVPTSLSYTADWERHGKAAGPIRNRAIVSAASMVFVVWDGKSRGSRNVIELALAAKKELHVLFP